MRVKEQGLTIQSSGWLTATADLNRWAQQNENTAKLETFLHYRKFYDTQYVQLHEPSAKECAPFFT
jgi:hypothetical protein